jgi:hypothetical protein
MVLSKGEHRRRPSRAKQDREGDWTTDEDSDDSLRNSGSLERHGRARNSKADGFQGRHRVKMYREWSPDGSRDWKRVSGRKSWDSDRDDGSPRRRSRRDETREKRHDAASRIVK